MTPREILNPVYNAETVLQAIMALTTNDECAVPAMVIHNLARIAHDDVSGLMDRLADLPSQSVVALS